MIAKEILIDGQPFTYMSEEGDPYIFNKMTPEDGARLLKVSKALLDELHIDFFLLYGTLLGYVREGHIINGDDDVDIAIFDKFEDSLYSALPFLSSKGLKINRIWKNELYSFHTERNGHLDIYIVREFGPSLWRPFAYQIRMTSIPKKYLNSFSCLNANGESLPVPSDSEGLLEWLYGKDWRIPQDNKGRSDIIARAIWLFPAKVLRKVKKIPKKLHALFN